MSKFVGQTRIIKAVAETGPRHIALRGSEHSGRTTLAQHIFTSVWSMHNTRTYLNNNGIEGLRLSIDRAMGTKADHGLIIGGFKQYAELAVFLKALEDAPDNVTFILTLSDNMRIPETITNRLTVYDMQPYMKDELAKFTDNDAMIRMLPSPGYIMQYDYGTFRKLVQFCDNVYLHGRIETENYAMKLMDELANTSVWPSVETFVMLMESVIKEHTPPKDLDSLFKDVAENWLAHVNALYMLKRDLATLPTQNRLLVLYRYIENLRSTK
jgi:hypothetical protein